VSVVVNVGVAHSEGVGGREGVMREKGAVYRALDKSGIAIVNADDAMVRRAARDAHVRKVETFGRGAGGERPKGSFAQDFAHEPSFAPMTVPPMSARPITIPPMSVPPAEILATAPPHYQLVDRVPEGTGSRVMVACAGRDLTVHLPIPGEAAAIDLTAALAAQEAASRELLTADQIETALAHLSLTGRGTVRTLERDVMLIDDTYNANPASMRAALATLHEIAASRRKVAILGEMKELGVLAEAEHEALGDDIVKAGVTLAIGCGGLIQLALEAAKAKGVEVVLTASAEDAAREAVARVQPGDAVLVKGSRSVGSERVVAALTSLRT
jgi:UDP-N-acetylmuramoyl-tripeptide--D-alanyl-D-alanine ligase